MSKIKRVATTLCSERNIRIKKKEKKRCSLRTDTRLLSAMHSWVILFSFITANSKTRLKVGAGGSRLSTSVAPKHQPGKGQQYHEVRSGFGDASHEPPEIQSNMPKEEREKREKKKAKDNRSTEVHAYPQVEPHDINPRRGRRP